MPEKNDPLYSRGKYRLEWDARKDGTLRTPYLQIVWYDDEAGRNRSRSTGTVEVEAAEKALDALYLERERGQAVCPTCLRPLSDAAGFLLTASIADYLTAREDAPSFVSIRARLDHVLDYLDATDQNGIICEEVDETFVRKFRVWSAAQPVIVGTKNPTTRDRAPGTTEASVGSLAAAVNFSNDRKDTPFKAAFKALPAEQVSHTPEYRSDVAELAKMFRYCLHPRAPKGQVWSEKMVARQVLHRRSLLRFLQASVATWARPDAVYDISTAPERAQWISSAQVLKLNPKGRKQTKKYRATICVPARFARLLDETEGFFVPVDSVRKAFEAMQDELELPRDRETGQKLIRRSMATIGRARLGEERWPQGKMMLGHVPADVSDLYALRDPANLGLVLAITTQIMDEIEALTPGAFTGTTPELKLIKGGAA